MKSQVNKRAVFALLMVTILVLSACGTLQIDTEPTMAPPEPAATITEVPLPTPAQVTEEADTKALAGEADTSQAEAKPTAEPQATVAADPTLKDLSGKLQTYTNPEYGFSLQYPSSWSLAEVNDEDFVGPGSRSVQFSQGTTKLVIGYRQLGEETMIMGSGAPAGDIENRGSIHIAGQDVARTVITFEGKDKVVMYGQPGALISAGGLEFAPRMDDFAQVDYGAIELSQSVQDEADLILSRLVIIDVEGGVDPESVDYDYSGWRSYTNEKLGYSLMVPGDADIMGANYDESVEFVGPVVGTDHWPWFSIQHFDSEFFSPPPGTDLRQWIADSNTAYKSPAQDVTIGGLPAVQLHVEESQQAYAMDEYYLINGDQLYKITILHAGGLQDWDLYDQFLQSITFDPV